MLRSLVRQSNISRFSLKSFRANPVRFYSDAKLTNELINKRLLNILQNYDKVPKDYKITNETAFSKDLGLDSLDVVEVVMAIEEEFSIGIPDDKVDKINTVEDAVKLIEADPTAS